MEALKSYRVIDMACGSGDAQTLCITDDDNVWSWGDGDYGKLGKDTSFCDESFLAIHVQETNLNQIVSVAVVLSLS